LISPALIQRLVYSKYLYWQGSEILDRGLPVSLGLSILNFQDSVEMVLRTIAEHVHANIKEKTALDQLIVEIEIATDNKIRVPYKSALIQLNKARVSFKHFGLAPIADDVQKFRMDVDLFFRESVKAFFELDFYNISLSNLIQKCRVRNYLKEAEKELAAKNYEASIKNVAIAFPLIFRRILSYDKPSHIPRIEIKKYDVARSLGNLPKIVETLTTMVNEHEEELHILMHRVNLAEYRRFKVYTPHVSISDSGSVVQIVYSREAQDTLENALFCLRFVIDAALSVQQNRVPNKWEDYHKRKLPLYRVIEIAPIIIAPKGKHSEIVREAEVGEELLGYFENYNHDEEYIAILQDDEVAHIKAAAVEKI
jgi:hypothetical protein